MNHHQYKPGPAQAARLDKSTEDWTLVVEKRLNHPPDRVWSALTEPSQLKEWAPFDASASLAEEGAQVRLTTVGAPDAPSETTVTLAEAPHLLVYQWGDSEMRWELEATETGTKLTLHTRIPRPYIAMGAAGWHVCLDVLEGHLSGDPIGRLVSSDALHHEGWQRLNREYSEQFGIEAPQW